MNPKILISAFILAVVIIGVCISMNTSHEDSTDYTLLDSPDNIVKGMTIDVIESDDVYSQIQSYIVTDVKDGIVSYDIISHFRSSLESYITLDTFSPSAMWFDYTDPSKSPDWMSVDVNGNRYHLQGTDTTESMGESFTRSYDLTIVYDGAKVTSVKGTKALSSEGMGHSSSAVTEYWTSNGKLYGYNIDDGFVSNEVEQDDFYRLTAMPFDMSLVDGELTVKDGKYNGVDAKIYNLNGKYRYEEYRGLRMIVYDGIVLKLEGKDVEGDEPYTVRMEMRIYLE